MRLAAIAFMLPIIFVPVEINGPVEDPLEAALAYNQNLQAFVERQEARREARAAERAAEAAAAARSAERAAPSGSVEAMLPEPWRTLAACETGNTFNPSIVSSDGQYHGLFQFLDSTWQAMGGSGSASDASVSEQLQRAQALQAQSGWGQWPTCAAGFG